MKLNDEERQIMVNMKGLALVLDRRKAMLQWIFGMSLPIGFIMQFFMQCQHFL